MSKAEKQTNMGIINPAYEKERACMGSMLDMARWIKPQPTTQSGQCPNCGWQADDPERPPNFCPECGRPFDRNTINTNPSSEVQQ